MFKRRGGFPFLSRVSASLFDLALLIYQIDPSTPKHPPAVYIPKSETAEEALQLLLASDPAEAGPLARTMAVQKALQENAKQGAPATAGGPDEED